jgi:hypothetical protein
MAVSNRTRPSEHRWQDWANLVLGAWLFLSPWILGFAGAGAEAPAGGGGPAIASTSSAAWDAWVIGVIIAIVAISALVSFQPWQEWVNVVLGAWLFVAPWVLGFSGVRAAAWDHWIVGILVFAFAAWALQDARSRPITAAEAGFAGNKPDTKR